MTPIISLSNSSALALVPGFSLTFMYSPRFYLMFNCSLLPTPPF